MQVQEKLIHRIFARFLMITLLCSQFNCNCCAETIDLKKDDSSYNFQLKAIKRLLREVLPEPDKKLLDRTLIVITHPREHEISVESKLLPSGAPIINFSADFCQQLNDLIDAQLIETTYKEKGFNTKYFQYLWHMDVQNTKARKNQLVSDYVLSPFEYREMSDSERLVARRKSSKATDRELSGSLFFVLAHEFAHLKYGDSLDEGDFDPQIRRVKEDRADQFAFEMMVTLDPELLPLYANHSLLLVSMFEHGLQQDPDDHSAADERMKASLLASRKALERTNFPRSLKQPSNKLIDELLTDLKKHELTHNHDQ